MLGRATKPSNCIIISKSSSNYNNLLMAKLNSIHSIGHTLSNQYQMRHFYMGNPGVNILLRAFYRRRGASPAHWGRFNCIWRQYLLYYVTVGTEFAHSVYFSGLVGLYEAGYDKSDAAGAADEACAADDTIDGDIAASDACTSGKDRGRA